MESRSVASKTQSWYEAYYARQGADRNDRLNPEVVFQNFASEDAILRALRRINLDRQSALVLDVGCGAGASLSRFLGLDMPPENLFGIDVLAERIESSPYHGLSLSVEDAQAMSFSDGQFDLVMESTMFVQLTDESVARHIAAEMLRVTTPGGFILLCDWRYGRPGKADEYRALDRDRIRSLFHLERECEWVASYPGALVPPLGRRVSRWAPSTYFLLRRVLPPLVGLNVTLLQRSASDRSHISRA